MGLGRKALELLTKNPEWNGKIAAIAAMLYYIDFERGPKLIDLANLAGIGLGTYITSGLGIILLAELTKPQRALRLRNYKIIKKLKEKLNQQTPPTLTFSGTQKIDYSIADFVKSKYIRADKIAKIAREKHDPASAIYSAILYFGSANNIDEGLIILRDAMDWLGRKRPKLSLKAKALLANFSLAVRGGRLLVPLELETYMLSAAYESIRKPEHAWYWSTLGKMLADELNTSRAEMYVFHALLATAQKRSDQDEAWKEAFEAMRQKCKPVRLGESRNPTWALKDDKQYFSGTTAFKGNNDREELQKEWEDTGDLEQKLEENAVVPQRLYITPEPYDDYYVYMMRYLKGETLDEQLKRGNKSGLDKVEKVLARILVQCQTDGLAKIPIKEKTAKKLASLGLGHMMKYFEKAMTDLEKQPLWVVNKDGHPQQWQMLDEKYAPAEIGVLDMEKMRETHPLTNESANLLECNELTNEERQAAIARFAGNIRREGRKAQKNEFAQAYQDDYSGLLTAHNLSTLHRAICLESAWAEPDRNKTPQERLKVINNALRATDSLKEYQSQEDYEGQRQTFEKIRELIPT